MLCIRACHYLILLGGRRQQQCPATVNLTGFVVWRNAALYSSQQRCGGTNATICREQRRLAFMFAFIICVNTSGSKGAAARPLKAIIKYCLSSLSNNLCVCCCCCWCGLCAAAAAAADDPDGEPSWMQKVLLGPGSHLALAILCSKAMIPLKLPVAVALTPYVYR